MDIKLSDNERILKSYYNGPIIKTDEFGWFWDTVPLSMMMIVPLTKSNSTITIKTSKNDFITNTKKDFTINTNQNTFTIKI